MKLKIRNLVSPLYNKVWHTPKGRLAAKIKKACDDLPRNQRLMVVTILLSAFILATSSRSAMPAIRWARVMPANP